MDRATFTRALRWTPAQEQVTRTAQSETKLKAQRDRPAPWPTIMLIQRLAFQRGEAFAYEAACALTPDRAAA